MFKKLRIRFFLLLIAFVVAGTSCSKSSPSLGPGSVAPDFAMRDLSGNTVRLADFRGSVVLLNFWATWCPPCREEVPSLARLKTVMGENGFRMLTVAIDEGDGSSVAAFFRMTGYQLPTIPDPGGRLAKLYGVTGVPETFILDRNGIVRKKIVGPILWDDPSVVRYLAELRNS